MTHYYLLMMGCSAQSRKLKRKGVLMVLSALKLDETFDERKEFEIKVMPHIHTLFGAALRLTRSCAGAKNLVQETYLKAFRSFE